MAKKNEFILDLDGIRANTKKYYLGLWRLVFTRNLTHTWPDGTTDTIRGLTDKENKIVQINSRFRQQLQREAFLHEFLHILDYYREDHPKGLRDDEQWTMFRECLITYGQACFENMLQEREK